jgi:hypothetical protein
VSYKNTVKQKSKKIKAHNKQKHNTIKQNPEYRHAQTYQRVWTETQCCKVWFCACRKFTQEQAMKVLGARRKWAVNATPWPLHSRKRSPVPTGQGAAWARGPVADGMQSYSKCCIKDYYIPQKLLTERFHGVPVRLYQAHPGQCSRYWTCTTGWTSDEQWFDSRQGKRFISTPQWTDRLRPRPGLLSSGKADMFSWV